MASKLKSHNSASQAEPSPVDKYVLAFPNDIWWRGNS